jgi:hypothetical protein
VIADKNFLHTTYSFGKAVTQTLAFADSNIVANGGSFHHNRYWIKTEAPRCLFPLEQSFPCMRMAYQVAVKDSGTWVLKAGWRDFVYGNGDDDLYKLTPTPGATMETTFKGTGMTLLGSWNIDGGQC